MVINIATYSYNCYFCVFVSLFDSPFGDFCFFRLHWVLLDLTLQMVNCSLGMEAAKLGLPGHLTVPSPLQPILTLHLRFLLSWIILLLSINF